MAGSKQAPATPAERSEHFRTLAEASTRVRREHAIAKLIESSPPLTADQKSRLAVLLNAHPEVGA